MIAPRCLALTLTLLIPSLAESAAAPADREEGRKALDRSRAAYWEAGAFREAVELTVELPGGHKELKAQEYGVGARGAAFMTLSSNGKVIFRIVAREGRMVGTQFNIDKRYAVAPFTGDFAASLRRLGGAQAQMGPPPAVVARLGGDLDGFLDALRFGILEPVQVVEAAEYSLLGQPAPDVSLRSLGGGTVSLADLKSSVVVLDFWATWCVPCWKALPHTAELAAWAKSSGLPVKVFAVDTLENTSDPGEQSRLAAEFLRARKLDLPVLI